MRNASANKNTRTLDEKIVGVATTFIK